MKTLKITLLSVLTLLSSAAMSQTFGVGAGANYSTIHFSNNNGEDDLFDGYKNLLGLNVGGFYNLDFNDNMGLRFGLKYSTKGWKYESESTYTFNSGGVSYSQTSRQTSSARLNYIQINPMFKYKMEVGRDNAFYAMVGPYMSVGVTGRQKGEWTSTYTDGTGTYSEGDTYDEKIEFGEDGDGIDFIDFGLTPAVGFELGNIFMEASYDLGLNNIDTENDPDFKVQNRNFSLTVGYVFGK